MNFKVVSFSEVDGDTWDRWVADLVDVSYLHSSAFLQFVHAYVGEEHRLTFACLGDDGRPLAICPLVLSSAYLGDRAYLEASCNGAPLGLPAFAAVLPSTRRRLQKKVYDYYHRLILSHGAVRAYVRHHPLTLAVLGGNVPAFQLDILAHGYVCHPQNTVVVDLRKSMSQLSEEVHRYQRRHIARAPRNGLAVRGYRGPAEDTTGAFREYQAAHRRAAGRLTRPQATFDVMLDLLRRGRATLFVAFHGQVPISYLYCGEFHTMAFGWSQANVAEHAKVYPPRHYLEWQAMMTYKSRGFAFYEVGTRWFGPQPYKVPSPKELSIAEFKERYGGLLLPDLAFERFFDGDLLAATYRQRMDDFVGATLERLHHPSPGA